MEPILLTPQMTPEEIVRRVREYPGVFLTSTGMRDAGQSDYKNRLRLHDLATLAPFYNRLGLFSAECHGGGPLACGVDEPQRNPLRRNPPLSENDAQCVAPDPHSGK